MAKKYKGDNDELMTAALELAANIGWEVSYQGTTGVTEAVEITSVDGEVITVEAGGTLFPDSTLDELGGFVGVYNMTALYAYCLMRYQLESVAEIEKETGQYVEWIMIYDLAAFTAHLLITNQDPYLLVSRYVKMPKVGLDNAYSRLRRVCEVIIERMRESA
jgi:hypothetical protein